MSPNCADHNMRRVDGGMRCSVCGCFLSQKSIDLFNEIASRIEPDPDPPEPTAWEHSEPGEGGER